MDNIFLSLDAILFSDRFKTNDDCRAYLYEIKWKDGYKCKLCNHTRDSKGRTPFHRRCRRCRYDESVLCDTLFQDLRMPVRKAFYMLFRIASKIKGLSSCELAKEVGVEQCTAWLFRLKVKHAMRQKLTIFGERRAENARARDESHFKTGEAGRGAPTNSFDEPPDAPKTPGGRSHREFKAFCNLAMTRTKKNQAKRTKNKSSKQSGTCADNIASVANTSPFVCWSQIEHLPGYLIALHLWLRGIHHKCSFIYLPTYYDEYFYRFHFRKTRELLFHDIICRLVGGSARTYPLLKRKMSVPEASVA